MWGRRWGTIKWKKSPRTHIFLDIPHAGHFCQRAFLSISPRPTWVLDLLTV